MQYFVCNAFTAIPFSGNPATVVMTTVKDAIPEHTHLAVAAELTTVETVFISPPTQSKVDFDLRFFTRKKEMNFCGHATLAAAHILTTEYRFPSEEIFFWTKTGVVIVRRKTQKFFELNLKPSVPKTVIGTLPEETLKALLDSLNFPFEEPRKSVVDVVHHVQSGNLILMMNTASTVTSAKPNSAKLMACAPEGVSKLTLTALPSLTLADEHTPEGAEEAKWKPYAFVTRLFAPWIGIEEDAVSGASHAILAKLWGSRSEEVARENELRCFQASPRGGEILLTVQGDRVGVAGEAVTIAKGVVMMPKM